MGGTISPSPGRGPGRRASDVVAVGTALTLGVALLLAVYRAVGEPLSPRLPVLGVEFFWTIPAGMLLLSLPLIAATALLAALRPGTMPLSRATAVVSLVPLLSVTVVLIREKVPDPVHVMLAAGLAMTLGRWVARREGAVARWAALAAPLLVVPPVATLGLVLAVPPLAEARTAAALPPAPRGARNVVLIVWDTVRERDVSLGRASSMTTPNLARRAAGGVTFERAYATAPWTLSSHGSLFTGRRAQRLGIDWVTGLDRRFPTLAEILSRAGYRTAGFTANLDYTMRPSGLARGFQHYEDWPVPLGPRALLSHLRLVQAARRHAPFDRLEWLRPVSKDAAEVTDRTLAWLDDAVPRHQPFFVFLNYFNAHDPYHAPAAFRARFPGRSPRDAYDAAIAYQDAELERLFRGLAARGLLDHTVVVFTSDHGEAFGEHGYWGHGANLYDDQIHVPLTIWAPGLPAAGARIGEPVSLRDVPATIVDLALPAPLATGLGGRSLARWWGAAPARPDTVVSGANHAPRERGTQSERGNAMSVVVGRWHYMVAGTGREELYDVMADPDELHDLAGEDSLLPFIRDVRQQLDAAFDERWTDAVHRAEQAHP